MRQSIRAKFFVVMVLALGIEVKAQEYRGANQTSPGSTISLGQAIQLKPNLALRELDVRSYGIGLRQEFGCKRPILDFQKEHVINFGTFYLRRFDEQLIGFAAARNVEAGLHYAPMESFSVIFNTRLSKFRDLSGIYNDVSLNLQLNLALSKFLIFHGYAGYSTFSVSNVLRGMMPNSPFSSKSYWAGGIEVRPIRAFGLEGGLIRQFNPWRMQWENDTYYTIRLH